MIHIINIISMYASKCYLKWMIGMVSDKLQISNMQQQLRKEADDASLYTCMIIYKDTLASETNK